MAGKTEICNMAISHLGIGKEIANIETEKSEEANACNRFFNVSREAVLADIDWPFATGYFTLNLITEGPDSEWGYSYRYPTNCLSIRRIMSGNRNDTVASTEPYKLLKDSAGKLIYCDKQDAVVEITENITDTSFFSAEFNLALSFRLASYIAPRLTGGDPFKLKGDMLSQYNLELREARKKAINEEKHEPIPDSDMITVRS